jgi:phosphocarrier protein
MTEKNVTVNNKAGIHCRPSSAILTAVEDFPDVEFEICSSKGETNLSSILGLLAIGLQYGDEVTVKAEGPDEEAACEKIAGLFAYEFDFPPQ